jgi:hypothetical protein
VVEGRQDAAFRAALKASGADAIQVGEVKGLDYSNGDQMVLRIYEARATAEQGAKP